MKYEPYQYAPLPKVAQGQTLIRVLDLHPMQNGSLECTISTVDASKGGYQALSYEWGSSETPSRITIRDGKEDQLRYISVTGNLRSALRDLRDSPALRSKRFWIDQICINQRDDRERAHQVALMAKVYRNASQVVTYLGSRSDDAETETKALELIDRLAKHFKPNFDIFTERSSRELWADGSLLPVRGFPDAVTENDPGWLTVLRIVYSGWLRRLWMLQENILCPKTVMLRGPSLLDWSSVAAIPFLFIHGCLPLRLLHWHWPKLDFEISPRQIYFAVREMWLLRARIHSRLGQRTEFNKLESNMRDYAYLACKEPRDHIYALLGISSDIDELGIVPDYERSDMTVFMDLTMRIIKNDPGGLCLLRRLGFIDNHHPNITHLPSWMYRPGKVVEGMLDPHRPHPTVRPSCRFDTDSIMVLQGRMIDRIEFATPAVPYPDPDDDEDKPLCDEWAEGLRQSMFNVAAVLEHRGVTLENMATIFHALVQDCDAPSSTTLLDASHQLWCYLARFAQRLLEYVDSKRNEEQPYCEKVTRVLVELGNALREAGKDVYDDPNHATNRGLRELTESVMAKAVDLGRSLSVSEKERVCNTTGKAQIGDMIALFAGGDSAYVLRPVDSGLYRYVGTAYVAGIMDGEAYEGILPHAVDVDIKLI